MATKIETEPVEYASHLEESLPPAYYLSPEIFQRERGYIFHREWYCLGREEQAPEPGDYFTAEAAWIFAAMWPAAWGGSQCSGAAHGAACSTPSLW